MLDHIFYVFLLVWTEKVFVIQADLSDEFELGSRGTKHILGIVEYAISIASEALWKLSKDHLCSFGIASNSLSMHTKDSISGLIWQMLQPAVNIGKIFKGKIYLGPMRDTSFVVEQILI